MGPAERKVCKPEYTRSQCKLRAYPLMCKILKKKHGRVWPWVGSINTGDPPTCRAFCVGRTTCYASIFHNVLRRAQQIYAYARILSIDIILKHIQLTRRMTRRENDDVFMFIFSNSLTPSKKNVQLAHVKDCLYTSINLYIILNYSNTYSNLQKQHANFYAS